MRGLVSSTWLLFVTHLARVWWSRRAQACYLLTALTPAIAASAAAFAETSGTTIAVHLGGLLLQVVVPLLALVAGSAVVSEEIEDRTITYLFSRPIPRASVLVGRWLAAVAFVSVLLAGGAALTVLLASRTAAPGPLPDAGVWWPLLAGVLVGGVVYSALFAVAGVFCRHPMIVGVGYAFAFEGFLANMPGRNQALTVQYHLRGVVAGTGSPAWREVEGFAGPFDGTGAALLTLGVVAGVVMLAGAWRITRREFVLTA